MQFLSLCASGWGEAGRGLGCRRKSYVPFLSTTEEILPSPAWVPHPPGKSELPSVQAPMKTLQFDYEFNTTHKSHLAQVRVKRYPFPDSLSSTVVFNLKIPLYTYVHMNNQTAPYMIFSGLVSEGTLCEKTPLQLPFHGKQFCYCDFNGHWHDV